MSKTLHGRLQALESAAQAGNEALPVARVTARLLWTLVSDEPMPEGEAEFLAGVRRILPGVKVAYEQGN